MRSTTARCPTGYSELRLWAVRMDFLWDGAEGSWHLVKRWIGGTLHVVVSPGATRTSTARGATTGAGRPQSQTLFLRAAPR
jgi:hypothetical protein